MCNIKMQPNLLLNKIDDVCCKSKRGVDSLKVSDNINYWGSFILYKRAFQTKNEIEY
jgi:hypothetical protein